MISDLSPNLNPSQNPQVQAVLAQFKDIEIPDPVTWWPLAGSVWALIISIIGIVIGLSWYYWVSYKNNRYRREATQKFEAILNKKLPSQEAILAINQLLKQVAITHYGRTRVSSLSGEAWLKFLQKTGSYIEQPKNLLSFFQSSYQPHSLEINKAEFEGFLTYSRAWIKGHHK